MQFPLTKRYKKTPERDENRLDRVGAPCKKLQNDVTSFDSRFSSADLSHLGQL